MPRFEKFVKQIDPETGEEKTVLVEVIDDRTNWEKVKDFLRGQK